MLFGQIPQKTTAFPPFSLDQSTGMNVALLHQATKMKCESLSAGFNRSTIALTCRNRVSGSPEGFVNQFN